MTPKRTKTTDARTNANRKRSWPQDTRATKRKSEKQHRSASTNVTKRISFSGNPNGASDSEGEQDANMNKRMAHSDGGTQPEKRSRSEKSGWAKAYDSPLTNGSANIKTRTGMKQDTYAIRGGRENMGRKTAKERMANAKEGSQLVKDKGRGTSSHHRTVMIHLSRCKAKWESASWKTNEESSRKCQKHGLGEYVKVSSTTKERRGSQEWKMEAQKSIPAIYPIVVIERRGGKNGTGNKRGIRWDKGHRIISDEAQRNGVRPQEVRDLAHDQRVPSGQNVGGRQTAIHHTRESRMRNMV